MYVPIWMFVVAIAIYLMGREKTLDLLASVFNIGIWLILVAGIFGAIYLIGETGKSLFKENREKHKEQSLILKGEQEHQENMQSPWYRRAYYSLQITALILVIFVVISIVWNYFFPMNAGK